MTEEEMSALVENAEIDGSPRAAGALVAEVPR